MNSFIVAGIDLVSLLLVITVPVIWFIVWKRLSEVAEINQQMMIEQIIGELSERWGIHMKDVVNQIKANRIIIPDAFMQKMIEGVQDGRIKIPESMKEELKDLIKSSENAHSEQFHNSNSKNNEDKQH